VVSVEIFNEKNCPYRISTRSGTKPSLQNGFYTFSDVQYSSNPKKPLVPGSKMSLLCTLLFQINTPSNG